MQFAIDESTGRLVSGLVARTGAYACPQCLGPVTPRQGAIRRPHFAHQALFEHTRARLACPYYDSRIGTGQGHGIHIEDGKIVDLRGRPIQLIGPSLFRQTSEGWYLLLGGQRVVAGGDYLLYLPPGTVPPTGATPVGLGPCFWLVTLPDPLPSDLQAILDAQRLTIHHAGLGLVPSLRRANLGERVVITVVAKAELQPEEAHFVLQVQHARGVTRYRRVDHGGHWPTFEFVARESGVYVLQDTIARVTPLRLEVDGVAAGAVRPFDFSLAS